LMRASFDPLCVAGYLLWMSGSVPLV